MTRYECEGCGQLADIVGMEQSQMRQRCPICDEQTLWTLAFTDEGVSF
ncbi:hypothetical protein [Haladaptatus sp. NG-SE-30]